MKIGLIVDGEGEPLALDCILSKINSSNVILKARFAGMHPKASPKQIAKAADGAVKVLLAKGVTMLVVLIDLEDSPCAVNMAREIEQAFFSQYEINTQVVVKKHSVENWLIADPAGLKQMSARFDVTRSFEDKVYNDRADHIVNAADLLDSIAIKKNYHKRNDPPAIMSHLLPDRIAQNSRSFRRLLRVVGHNTYLNQSKNPVKNT